MEKAAVKKATSIHSLNDINLSKRAKSFLIKKGDLDEIIWLGRRAAFWINNSLEGWDEIPKSLIELSRELDLAGYIRHDITRASFSIGRIYSMVFCNSSSVLPAYFDDFADDKDYHKANKLYEEFENPTEERLTEIRSSLIGLKSYLYNIITYRSGIDGYDENGEQIVDLRPHGLEETANHLGMTREGVRRNEAMALRRMRAICSLPPVKGYTTEEYEQRYIWKNSPQVFDANDDIGQLQLSIRTYNCLKRAGVCTINDVINKPKEEWSKVRNLGRLSVIELQDKMHEIGYSEFAIAIS